MQYTTFSKQPNTLFLLRDKQTQTIQPSPPDYSISSSYISFFNIFIHITRVFIIRGIIKITPFPHIQWSWVSCTEQTACDILHQVLNFSVTLAEGDPFSIWSSQGNDRCNSWALTQNHLISTFQCLPVLSCGCHRIH